jgi:EAL domain-containing protein (putative c-di-GMP-specific phosphodiesterase class I)
VLHWNPRTGGMVPPEQFLPILEESGLIAEVEEWALQASAMQAAEWRLLLGNDFYVSVDLSPRALASRQLHGDLAEVLRHAEIDPGVLQVSVAEPDIAQQPAAMHGLRLLSQTGARIALDEFGGQLSSLQQLRAVHWDAVKLSKSIVANMATNRGDAAIVSGLLAAAHSLRLQTIADGVDNEDQAATLRTLGCHAGKGRLFAGPMPAMEFHRWLTTHRSMRQYDAAWRRAA